MGCIPTPGTSAGRLIQAESVTHTLVYTYNGDGVRVANCRGWTDDNAVVQDMVGLPQVLVETAGGQTTLYVYGVMRLAQVTGEMTPSGSWGMRWGRCGSWWMTMGRCSWRGTMTRTGRWSLQMGQAAAGMGSPGSSTTVTSSTYSSEPAGIPRLWDASQAWTLGEAIY